MKEIFKELMELRDVQGILFLSDSGDVIYQETCDTPMGPVLDKERLRSLTGVDTWPDIQKNFSSINESELVYDEFRIYMRKTAGGYLLVFFGPLAVISLIQIYSDIIKPALDNMKKPKGLGRFFKR